MNTVTVMTTLGVLVIALVYDGGGWGGYKHEDRRI